MEDLSKHQSDFLKIIEDLKKKIDECCKDDGGGNGGEPNAGHQCYQELFKMSIAADGLNGQTLARVYRYTLWSLKKGRFKSAEPPYSYADVVDHIRRLDKTVTDLEKKLAQCKKMTKQGSALYSDLLKLELSIGYMRVYVNQHKKTFKLQ